MLIDEITLILVITKRIRVYFLFSMLYPQVSLAVVDRCFSRGELDQFKLDRDIKFTKFKVEFLK